MSVPKISDLVGRLVVSDGRLCTLEATKEGLVPVVFNGLDPDGEAIWVPGKDSDPPVTIASVMSGRPF